MAPVKGITIYERDPGNQAWTVPGDIDNSNFELGVDFIELYVEKPEPKGDNELNYQGFPGGYGIATPLKISNLVYNLSGWCGDLKFTDKNGVDQEITAFEHKQKIWQFYGRHRQIGNPVLYLISRTQEGYDQYPDPTDTPLPYVPGWIAGLTTPFDVEEQLYTLKLIFQGVYI